jgi:DNA-binding MarR family transcriptional regulator
MGLIKMKETESIGFLMADVARMIRAEFERRIADAGLEVTPGEARALVHINARAGWRQNAIAEGMGVEPMTFSGYVDKLEALGLVERVPDPADRRAKNVVLAGNAEAMVRAIRKHSGAMLNEMQDGLDAGERETLKHALKIMRANFAQLSKARETA